ncbi:CsbD family protein [Oceanobacillus indicireducens]|uniref:Stress response protein CsbD n=1 Tax=Oceanobacillus indicireducens TaxID=1004261 RepID=A0A917Y4K8_9BACI|nr:CsbD family protein [Oceanobacillus indicireducens]GGN66196.1 stress response protein CsbD [Oceanobacillus indicireducens]
MSEGFKNKVSGEIDKAKGEVKDKFGKARGDLSKQAEGKFDKAKGDVKKEFGEMKDKFDHDSSDQTK